MANDRRSLRIVHVISASDGAEWLVEIAARLRDRGHDVSAVVAAGNGRLSQSFDSQQIPWTAAPLGPEPSAHPRLGPFALLPQAWKAMLATLRLTILLRRLQADIVCTHLFRAIVLGRIAGWAARVPVRISMVPGPYHLGSRLQRLLDRLTWRMDHRVVAGCAYTRDIYRALGVPASRLSCIYYGVDPTRFDPAHAAPDRVRAELGVGGAPLVGLVAYFYAPEDGPLVPPVLRGRGLKGHEFFIEAARLVLERRPETRFVLVGDGFGSSGEVYRNELEERCRSLGLNGSLLFAGFRRDVPDVLAALDVSVQCSLVENLGGTIESLLMETPTIATRVGGMPEAVRHEETGLLVPPADPGSLATAICRMLDHRDQGRSWARAGRRLMLERFTLEQTVADIDAIYRQLAGERGIRAA